MLFLLFLFFAWLLKFIIINFNFERIHNSIMRLESLSIFIIFNLIIPIYVYIYIKLIMIILISETFLYFISIHFTT